MAGFEGQVWMVSGRPAIITTDAGKIWVRFMDEQQPQLGSYYRAWFSRNAAPMRGAQARVLADAYIIMNRDGLTLKEAIAAAMKL